MVFSIFKKLSSSDEKYEQLYYKYSKIKLDLAKEREKNQKELKECKEKFIEKFAKEIIKVYETVEDTKNSSYKVNATTKELQELLMNVNKLEKELKHIFKQYYIEEIIPKERMYDPELHEVASYVEAKGMKPGIIVKTVKKGFKFMNKIVKKPRVVVAK
jgi:molecular chaperone GrpE